MYLINSTLYRVEYTILSINYFDFGKFFVSYFVQYIKINSLVKNGIFYVLNLKFYTFFPNGIPYFFTL